MDTRGVPGGSGYLAGDAVEGDGERAADGGLGPLPAAPEEDDEGEHLRAGSKKVYQVVLADPVDLSHGTADAVARRLGPDPAAYSEGDLEGDLPTHLGGLRQSVTHGDRAHADGVDVRPVSREQRADQPLPLEPVGQREAEAARLGHDAADGRLLARLRVADGEALAPLGAAAREHAATVGGGHTRAEAVLVGALAAARLVRPLHDDLGIGVRAGG
jgi:hypothetical protein